MSDLGPEADGTAGAADHPTRSAAPARTAGTWGLRADLLRHGAGHSSDKVGYVELFFDLVFVFAVTQLSHSLIAHPDVETLLHTLILGAAVWYLWIDTTWVTNWLDPDRLPVRTMLIVLMALGLVMSSAIPEAFDSKALLFAVPYVTIQVGRSVFAALALNRRWSENGAGFLRITAWVSVSGILWITGALVDDGLRLGLWGAAVLIDYAGPRAMFAVPFFGRTDPHTWTVRADHMAERVSLFVIISLGESIIITGTAFAELEVTAVTLLSFGAAFASTVLMWLLYFDRSERRATEFFARADSTTGMVAQTAYTYVPFLLVLGIVLTAVADELVLLAPTGGAGGAEHAAGVAAGALDRAGTVAGSAATHGSDPWTAGLVCGAAAVYLLGNLLFRRATGGRWSLPHLVGIVAVVVLFAAHPWAAPLTLNWVSNAVLLAVIVGDVVVSRREPAQERA